MYRVYPVITFELAQGWARRSAGSRPTAPIFQVAESKRLHACLNRKTSWLPRVPCPPSLTMLIRGPIFDWDFLFFESCAKNWLFPYVCLCKERVVAVAARRVLWLPDYGRVRIRPRARGPGPRARGWRVCNRATLRTPTSTPRLLPHCGRITT